MKGKDSWWDVVTYLQCIVLSAGSHILEVEVAKDQMYAMKLKGISICFSMLKAALCGSYVNFGVFRLYGDDALDNALKTFVKLLLSIPQSDLLVRQQYTSCLLVLRCSLSLEEEIKIPVPRRASIANCASFTCEGTFVYMTILSAYAEDSSPRSKLRRFLFSLKKQPGSSLARSV